MHISFVLIKLRCCGVMCIIRLCNGLDVLSVLCKLQASLYVNRVKVADISNKPILVGEYAFSLMEFVG